MSESVCSSMGVTCLNLLDILFVIYNVNCHLDVDRCEASDQDERYCIDFIILLMYLIC